MVVVQRKAGITREEFVHHWRELHPAYVRDLPGVKGYRQNLSIEHRKQWPFDGIAEILFDSVADVKVAFAGPEATALFKHEEDFIGKMEWSIVEEHPVDL